MARKHAYSFRLTDDPADARQQIVASATQNVESLRRIRWLRPAFWAVMLAAWCALFAVLSVREPTAEATGTLILLTILGAVSFYPPQFRDDRRALAYQESLKDLSFFEGERDDLPVNFVNCVCYTRNKTPLVVHPCCDAEVVSREIHEAIDDYDASLKKGESTCISVALSTFLLMVATAGLIEELEDLVPQAFALDFVIMGVLINSLIQAVVFIRTRRQLEAFGTYVDQGQFPNELLHILVKRYHFTGALI